MIPSIGVKSVSSVAPEGRQAVYSVGVDVYRGAGGNLVAAQIIICDGLAHSHGNRRNVPQGFATDIVQVMEIVSVKFGQALDVISRRGIKEERVMLFDFRSDTFLNCRMFCEQVEGPGGTSCRC